MSIVLCLLAVLALTGCKKNSSNGTSKTKTQLLTQASWKMTAIGPDVNQDGQIETNQIEDCQKDNILTFSTNGTGTAVEGANVCAGEDATSSFAWNFKNNETVVHIDIEILGDVNIITLNETELKGYKDVPIGGGIIMRVVFSLNHP